MEMQQVVVSETRINLLKYQLLDNILLLNTDRDKH